MPPKKNVNCFIGNILHKLLVEIVTLKHTEINFTFFFKDFISLFETRERKHDGGRSEGDGVADSLLSGEPNDARLHSRLLRS